MEPGFTGIEPEISALPTDTRKIRAVAGDLLDRLPVDGVSVALYARADTVERLYASDPVAGKIEELQFLLGEGPGLDSYRGRCLVLADDLARSRCLWRWPGFARDATLAGARAVYAYPLRIGTGAPFGTALLYRTRPRTLTNPEITEAARVVRELAGAVLDEVAGTGRLVPTAEHPEPVFGQTSLPVATGITVAELGVTPPQALACLRAAAYAQHRSITHLADDIIAGRHTVDPDTR